TLDEKALALDASGVLALLVVAARPVAVPPRGRRELADRERAREGDPTRGDHPLDELDVGWVDDFAVVAPEANSLDDVGAGGHGGRGCSANGVEVPVVAPGRPEAVPGGVGEPRPAPVQRRDQVDEVRREPQIVVTEVGDVLAAGQLDAAVVRERLAA